jgi:hypothetical protein
MAEESESASTRKPKVDRLKAKDMIVVVNAIADPNYRPYCLRCTSLIRMKLEEPFLWTHDCGAIHDERQVLEE